MPDIGIIGGGVGGTHLGLFLRQQGVFATIYTAKTRISASPKRPHQYIPLLRHHCRPHRRP